MITMAMVYLLAKNRQPDIRRCGRWKRYAYLLCVHDFTQVEQDDLPPHYHDSEYRVVDINHRARRRRIGAPA